MTKRIFGAKIYLVYTGAFVRLVRLVLGFFVLFGIAQAISSYHIPSRFLLLLLGVLFMVDMFIRFKLVDRREIVPITNPKRGDITNSFSEQLLLAYAFAREEKHFFELLLKQRLVTFLLQKADIQKNELQQTVFAYKTLFLAAEAITKERKGQVITSADVFSAYLLQTEDVTKLLFKKEIKKEDIVHLCEWAVSKWQAEEGASTHELHFNGIGYADGLIYGWTPETKKYTKEVNWNIKDTKTQLVGRTEEFGEICRALLKKENNNILLVGPTGSGKEYVIKHFAMMSYRGLLEKGLNHKRLFELLVGEFIAGANEQGSLEERVGNIVSEIAHAGNVILYIANFDHLLGSSGFNIDMSGVLLPYLKAQELPIMAAMSNGAYKEYVEKNPIREMFTVITFAPPSHERMEAILFTRANSIESQAHTIITYNALKAVLQYAPSYLPDDHLPGSAVRLLTDTIGDLAEKKNRTLRKADIIAKVTKQTHIPVGEPTDAEANVLLHLKETLQKEVIGQDTALTALAHALQRLRATQKQREKPVSFLFLGPTGVGKTQTVKVLAHTYFDGEQNIIRLDMSEYANEDGLEKLIGTSGSSGVLTEAVHDKPYSLILLDEFEKAHPKVHNAFLQVLDDGRLTDGNGRTISFVNTFIIATSNAGSEYIRESMQKSDVSTNAFKRTLLDLLQEKDVFRPELLNRFDDIIVYTPLSDDAARRIISLLLSQLTAAYKEQDMVLVFDESVVTKILHEGLNKDFGARPLARYIADTIESPISQKILDKSLKRGDTITLHVDDQNTLNIS